MRTRFSSLLLIPFTVLAAAAAAAAADGEIDHPPLADAGPDSQLECTSPAGATATLDGTGSEDPDSTPGTNDDIVGFDWFEHYGLPDETLLDSGELCDVALPLGVHDVTLVVTDRLGMTDSDVTVQSVLDTTPPVGGVTAPASGACLGPEFLPVRIEDDFEDVCDPDLGRLYRPPHLLDTKLTARDGAPGDDFGADVSVHGDSLLIGAPGDDDSFPESGSAYLYRRDGDVWEREQKLRASDAWPGDAFGSAVAIDGDTVVIGAPNADIVGSDEGLAYVYHSYGGRWYEVDRLLACDYGSADRFGSSVAIDGDTIVVGSPRGEAPGDHDTGSAHVFQRFWGCDQAQLTAADGTEGDGFGTSVAVEGDWIVVGAPDHRHGAVRTGAVYLFRREADHWTQHAELIPVGASDGERFGARVAIDGDRIAVGAPGRSEPFPSAGAVYLFRRLGVEWVPESRLSAADGATNDLLGIAVAIAGDVVLAGAPGDDDLANDGGSAYLFERHGDDWRPIGKLMPRDPTVDGRFGGGVATRLETLFVGSEHARGDDGVAGATYVFEPTPGGEPTYDRHGDHEITVTAIDASGNAVDARVTFTIDTIAPRVSIIAPPSDRVLVDDTPFPILFTTLDDDGASGGVVRETVYLNGCPIYDGWTYGDADGRLQDEVLIVNNDERCRIGHLCGFGPLEEIEIRVEAEDCAGNVGEDVADYQSGPLTLGCHD